MTSILVIVLLLLCLFLGAPVFCVFAAAALWGWYADGTSVSVVGTDIFRLSSNFVLIAIPLFTFAGYLLGESNAPKRLVKLSRAFFGWMPGGLAIVSVVICSLFTAFTGASGVTIVALGALLFPALLRDRYSENFSLGLVTTGGSLGLLFAPSVPLIIYGVITETPIFDMFIAGVLPGVLMVIVLCAFSVYMGTRTKTERIPLRWKAMREALWEAKWEIPLPVVVLGGIYGGVFAASEAAAVTAFWALIVEVLIYREISLAQLKQVIRESMTMVGGILIIMATAMASTNYFIDIDVPSMIFDFIQGFVNTKIMFLILLNVFLFGLGMILDIFSALVVVVPLITPIAQEYGINTIHLGIIFLANMQIGYLTPPLGMGLFISSYRFDKGILQITAACLPFIAMLIASVLVITYWADLSLFLVRAMGK
ncbi:MAG: TRAP transporter large permease [Thermodesulfobacteriota bacterium]